MNFSMINFTKI